jgi:hypothetical protein
LQKALADSGQNFIRVVKNGEKTKGEDREEWLPEGFEKKGGRKWFDSKRMGTPDADP